MLRDGLGRWLLIFMSALQIVPGLPVKAAADSARTITSTKALYQAADILNLRQQTADGGYILAGEKDDNIVLIKTDADGKMVWSASVDEGGSEYPESVRQTRDGGYIVSGDAFTNTTFNNRGFYVLKVASNGTKQWSRIYEGFTNASAQDVWQLTDGSYMLAGNYMLTAGGNYDLILFKLRESDGEIIQAINGFSKPGSQYIYGASPLSDGTSILVGSDGEDSDTATDGLIMKVDSDGNELWSKNVGNISNKIVLQSISAAPDGGYILVGNDNGGGQKLLLMKIDNDGNVEWERSYDGNYTSVGTVVIPTRDGGYLAGGAINGAQTPMYLLKTDAEGKKQWDQVFPEQSKAYSIVQLSDGSFSVVAGSPAAVLHVSVAAPTGLAADDQLNRISGWDEAMEYSTDGGTTYTPYSPGSEPVFSGNKEVRVRYKADAPAGYEAGEDALFIFSSGTNAALKVLSLDGVPLSGFDPNYSDYSVNVPESTDHVTVTGSVYDAGTQLVVNGLPAKADEAVTVALGGPSTEINIIATAENGNTKMYNITVNRVRDLSGNADLSGIAVNGFPIAGFSKVVTDYTVEVAAGTERVSVAADVYDAGAQLHINGISASSGEAVDVQLSGSTTVIHIEVTAENGVVQKVYTVTVNRPVLPSGNAKLNSLAISQGTLTPAFTTDRTEYTASVPYHVESVAITAEVQDQAAVLRINGQQADNGEAVTAALNTGVNRESVKVTAQSGTEMTYTIDITRAAPPASGGSDSSDDDDDDDTAAAADESRLTSLNLSEGMLEPAFSPLVQNYTVTVDKAAKSLKVYAEADGQSEILVNSSAIQSDGWSLPVELKETGDTTIDIAVRASNGQNMTYTLTVQRPDEAAEEAAQAEGAEGTPEEGGSGTEETAVSFSDTAGHWAEQVIGEAVRAGIIKGFANGSFRPDAQVTRGQFVTMLARALHLQLPAERIAFSDQDVIPVWAVEAAAAAQAAGITGGYPDGTFRPSAPITRAEMTTMLAKALRLPPSGNTSGFTDDEQIPDWARPYAAAAAQRGIISGRDGSHFAPDAEATRAEATAIIIRMLSAAEEQ